MIEETVEIKEKTPASRKLQADDAKQLLKQASKLIAIKGKKVREFGVAKSVSKEAIEATLGPTGNLRAPLIKVGKTIIVGFNEDIFSGQFA